MKPECKDCAEYGSEFCKYCLSESKVSQKQLDSLEKILDKAFARLGIDINFTKHFFDRINDPRNKEQITPKEIALLFKKEYIKFGKPISKLPPGSEAVMKDMESDINVPFVIKYDEKNKEIDLVAKTVMRKKNFKTPDKTYPVESVQLEEGVNDPSIFKAVFLAGGPGSGKSFIVGQTALTALGFKVVNSDDAFERGLKNANMDMTPDNIYSPKGQEIRNKAKAMTKNRQQGYINGRLGLVVDGTGKDYAKIEKQAKQLREIGYEVAMIFVNTDEDTALKRNQMRSRSLPDATVSKMWKDVQKNLGKFQSFFRQKMFIVDNSEGSNFGGAVLSTYKQISAWSKKKPSSKGASAWIKSRRPVKEEMTSTASIPDPAKTAQGPKFKAHNVTDRRRRKDKNPIVLKRFRKYMED
jgi:shikimate kinase